MGEEEPSRLYFDRKLTGHGERGDYICDVSALESKYLSIN